MKNNEIYVDTVKRYIRHKEDDPEYCSKGCSFSAEHWGKNYYTVFCLEYEGRGVSCEYDGTVDETFNYRHDDCKKRTGHLKDE